MASLQKKGNSWYCQFYWRDQRFTFAVGRVTKLQAEAKATKAAEIIELLERGVMKLPEGIGVAAFVKHNGHPLQRRNRRSPRWATCGMPT